MSHAATIPNRFKVKRSNELHYITHLLTRVSVVPKGLIFLVVGPDGLELFLDGVDRQEKWLWE